MQTFENQYNFRVENQIKVISALRNGPLSLNDLANKINVSFTAITKIVDQLKQSGVVVFLKKVKTKKKGRIPNYVKINTKVGVTCAIDISGSEMLIAISDLRNRIIVEQSIQTDYFLDQSSLEILSEKINDLLKNEKVENRKLLGICIAAPGMVRKDNGDIFLSYKLQKLQNISIVDYFFNRFGVVTNLYNNVKIGMVGERMFGCIPSTAKNYLFARVGYGCSVAISVDGKLYQGANGFCGETTSLSEKDELTKNNTNNILYGAEEIGFRANAIRPDLNLIKENNTIDIDKVAEMFNQGIPEIVNAATEVAKIDAVQFIAYNDILDLEYIVVSGNILRLGDKFKKMLVDYINMFDNRQFKAKILFSTLEKKPSLLGAIYQANNIYFLKRLEEITNEKGSASHYDISEAFGNNI